MITNYDMSLTGKGTHLGYWKTNLINDPSELPWPEDFIDLEWDVVERDAVAEYLDSQPDTKRWKGFSFCRLCITTDRMGSTDKSDGIYVWPAGLSHYVRHHNVKPPQEFIDHALGRARQTRVRTRLDPCIHTYPLPDWFRVSASFRVAIEHNHIPLGATVTIHSFVDDNVNIQTEQGAYHHYMRGDFEGLFEPVEHPTSQTVTARKWFTQKQAHVGMLVRKLSECAGVPRRDPSGTDLAPSPFPWEVNASGELLWDDAAKKVAAMGKLLSVGALSRSLAFVLTGRRYAYSFSLADYEQGRIDKVLKLMEH